MDKLYWTPPDNISHESRIPKTAYLNEELPDPFTRFLVDQYAPISVFVNEVLDIQYINGEVEHILKIPRSLARLNLNKMMDEKDLSTFRTGISKAFKSEEPVVLKNFRLSRAGKLMDLRFRQVELPQVDEPIVLVEVQPTTSSKQTEQKQEQKLDQNSYLQEQVKNLEKELETARKQTLELVRELETTNEELESSNRELLASNEELQSTNLELQSINEELYSVNSELQSKNEELSIVNNDLKNLLRSTGIGTIFLDNKLHIRRFTPPVRKQFNLIDTDVGRPITDFSTTFDHLNIGEVCREVFQSLESYEKEVSDKNGNHFLLRVLPYRTEEDEIKGLVLTFVDINELVQAKQESARKAEKFRVIFENSDNVILLLDADGQITSANRDLDGYSARQLEGKALWELLPEEYEKRIRQYIDAAFEENKIGKILVAFSDHGTKKVFYDLIFLPSFVEGEHSAFIMVMAQDVTLRELFKEELTVSLSQYESFMEHTRRPIALIDAQGKITKANQGFYSTYPNRKIKDSNFYDLLPVEDRENVKSIIEDIFNGKPYDEVEFELEEEPGKPRKFSMLATPVVIGTEVEQVALISSAEIE